MLVAKRLGSMPPSTTTFSDDLLQAYLAIFRGPLSDEAIGAIEELVTAVKKLKKGKSLLYQLQSQGRDMQAGAAAPLVVN